MSVNLVYNKRKRDPVFSQSEKFNLVELVTIHYNVLECKKTDAVSVRMKNEEWMTVAEEFNSIATFMQRDWRVLKGLWENLKKRARMVISQRNLAQVATADDSLKLPKEDPVLEKVIEVLTSKAEGFINPYRISDQHSDPNSIDCHESPRVKEEYEDQFDNDSENSLHPDWSPFPLVETRIAPAAISVGTNTSSKPARLLAGRRRPILAQKRFKTLRLSNQQSTQQHEAVMNILRLQEKQEKEKLNQEEEKTVQEKLRTEILREELKRLRKV